MTTTARSPGACVVLPRNDAGAALRLFCLPYAGGGASIYGGWGATLPAAISVCPVEIPGRGRRFRERAVPALPVLAERLAAELAPYLDRPFAFFGHSMGAIIAYELTRKLVERGLRAERLLASGRRAPQCPGRAEPLHPLPEAAFVERLRGLDGTPEAVLADPELMELMLPVLRADFTLCESYRHAGPAPLACPVSAFGGLADESVRRDELLAWAEVSGGPFRLRMFEGGHFFLNQAGAPLRAALCEELLPGARG